MQDCGGWEFAGMLLNAEIVCRANRLPVTCSGCVLLLTRVEHFGVV